MHVIVIWGQMDGHVESNVLVAGEQGQNLLTTQPKAR